MVSIIQKYHPEPLVGSIIGGYFEKILLEKQQYGQSVVVGRMSVNTIYGTRSFDSLIAGVRSRCEYRRCCRLTKMLWWRLLRQLKSAHVKRTAVSRCALKSVLAMQPFPCLCLLYLAHNQLPPSHATEDEYRAALHANTMSATANEWGLSVLEKARCPSLMLSISPTPQNLTLRLIACLRS